MSLTTMKRKSVILYGANKSGKPNTTLGYISYQGCAMPGIDDVPGRWTVALGNNGFSLNGSHRNVGYVGKNYAMSKMGTKFRGVHPIGYGGTNGRYPLAEPYLNALEVITLGNQFELVKPSVLSTRGMLEKKLQRIFNGQYPTNVVKNIATGNLTENFSQGNYLEKLSSANACVLGVDKPAQTGECKNQCFSRNSIIKRPFNTVTANAPYTKVLHIPVDQSTYLLTLGHRCALNPLSSNAGHVPLAFNGNKKCGGC